MHTLSKYHMHTVGKYHMHGPTPTYAVCFCVQTTQTHSLSKSLNSTQCPNQTCTLFVQITFWLLLLGVATNNIQILEILTQLVFCLQLASRNITLSQPWDNPVAEPVPLSPHLHNYNPTLSFWSLTTQCVQHNSTNRQVRS